VTTPGTRQGLETSSAVCSSDIMRLRARAAASAPACAWNSGCLVQLAGPCRTHAQHDHQGSVAGWAAVRSCVRML